MFVRLAAMLGSLAVALGAVAEAPEGYELVFESGFEDGSTDAWEMTDDKAWGIVEDEGDRVLELQRSSRYEPEVRSPRSIAWIKDLEVGSFVLEVRAKQTGREYGHRDLCFFFGKQDPANFYYVHLASVADDHANSVFLVDDAPRVSIAEERTDGTDWSEGYHTIRIARDVEAGTIEVYFNDLENPVMKATDTTHGAGAVGLGSFDDVGMFDDVKVWAKPGAGRVSLPIALDGTPWAQTMVTPFDRARREETYKVFTHLLDFDAGEPITKGAGGKYTHHRGLFIGWNDTLVGKRDLDTWHMSNCTQELAADLTPADAEGMQRLEIHWKRSSGRPVIKEIRTLQLSKGGDGVRIIDFRSQLETLAGDIELRGDLQHAGMQVRMANEVVDNQAATRYILPEGAEELDEDKVVGGWWACASVEVRGKRYWVLHMTDPNLVTGEPVYSIRRYARFGAFFEPDLTEDAPLDLNFRVAWTTNELDRTACQAMYDAYAASRK